jgi:hypothetical protein
MEGGRTIKTIEQLMREAGLPLPSEAPKAKAPLAPHAPDAVPAARPADRRWRALVAYAAIALVALLAALYFDDLRALFGARPPR